MELEHQLSDHGSNLFVTQSFRMVVINLLNITTA